MLFSSPEFLFLFLPIVLIGYVLLQKATGREHIYIWLSAASLFFYCWWDITLSWLIFCSIGLNFIFGKRLKRQRGLGGSRGKVFLTFGVFVNLLPLFYYKYSVFFFDNLNRVFGSEFVLYDVILPIGISFFTFQQITYIIDVYKGRAKDYAFFHYSTFVTFFPQLIAGPIVHHSEMMPQFDAKTKNLASVAEDFGIGFSIFVIGLFKKVIIADSLGSLASPVFVEAQSGGVEFISAWTGALAYTFQLYFDFSGYSDMAIGLARMFGITLPANFYSPYKATSIIEFWRRWHMTLSRFLRNYVYIPLGGNRKGEVRRHINLILTMVIGGIWHGAGWTFVFWGLLHGLYLVLNHFWNSVFSRPTERKANRLRSLISWALTFIAVVVAWVFFRSESFSSAVNILGGMIGVHGIVLPRAIFPFLSTVEWIDVVPSGGMAFVSSAFSIGASAAIAFGARNTIQLFGAYGPVLENQLCQRETSRFLFFPSIKWAFFIAALFCASVLSILGGKSSEFLYFNF